MRLIIRRRRLKSLRGKGAVVVRTGLVFLQQALNLTLRISACALQVFVGVVEFVLIEFELSLGDFELVLNIFLGAFGSRRELVGKAGDLVLVSS